MLILLREPNKIWGKTPEKGVSVMEKLIPGQVNQAALDWVSRSREDAADSQA